MLKALSQLTLRLVLSLCTAAVLIFILLRAIPGDPASIALGVNATDDAVAALSHKLGTDRPLIMQFFLWIGGLLHGDFGTSLHSSQNISPILIDRAQVSLILCFSAMVLSLCIAIPLGMWAARRANHLDGLALSITTQIGIAIPNFLAALLLVTIVAVHWRLLPAQGWVVPSDNVWAFLQRLILPVLALTLVQAAILARYVRNAVLEILTQDYIRTARMKGFSLHGALMHHGIRNAALPVLTVAGVQLTSLIVGAVVIEHVFMIPGLGSLLLDAVSTRDLPLVQAVVMFLVFFTLVVNFLIDVGATLIDPRIRK
ncbi:ABC transporter permease subunit [Corynebacterium sp. 3HC-13]|uniref:ABC transporter permease n=1 Tax=Corynebacterium poyangense TaxID=2684405 RepID=UPI001CCCF105|nr:ABC transporter permease [Corynebacterium poyangense]MBZ8178401.1 ABC transporter permease subunit [Corynebacterium poyangense]